MTTRGVTEATKELFIFYSLIWTMTHRCVHCVKFTKLHIYDLCMLCIARFLFKMFMSLWKRESDYVTVVQKALQ